MVPVAAGAANVDGVAGRCDGDHPCPHRASSAGDLAGGFAAVGQGNEEANDGFVIDLAIEDSTESLFGFGFLDRVQRIGKACHSHAARRAGSFGSRPQSLR